jgi:glycosyltransferase involved in cell wall biosynthesis
MKVSVLVPVFNGELHLAECLDSILAQDFRDLEILISDDGSTDQSLEIIKRFATLDPRIRWWKNPRNLGLTANSNACLKEARGEYIKFVHQDDKLLSASAIRKMVAVLDEHPGVSLVGSRQHLIGAASRPAIFSNRSGGFDGRQMIVTCLEQNTNLIGQPTLTLFRRSAARRGFDDRFVGHLDYEMWCHLLEQGDFFYLAEDLATWRVHENQQTARQEKTGSAHHEHLMFMETCYAKPWLQKAATDQMLFTQIYYLGKKYGPAARHLTSAMRSQLSPHRYAWQWGKHKAFRPLQKLLRKIARV